MPNRRWKACFFARVRVDAGGATAVVSLTTLRVARGPSDRGTFVAMGVPTAYADACLDSCDGDDEHTPLEWTPTHTADTWDCARIVAYLGHPARRPDDDPRLTGIVGKRIGEKLEYECAFAHPRTLEAVRVWLPVSALQLSAAYQELVRAWEEAEVAAREEERLRPSKRGHLAPASSPFDV